MSLREAYENAFREFSLEVHLLQSLASQETPDRRAVEQARRLVEQAHDAYRESRGLLAQFMLIHGEAGADATRRLAHQLWEEAGRPTGRAEEHWHRAEQLIRYAA